MELCAYATVNCNYEDWWWKARLGKCYFHLGLLRDAEKQFSSSLKTTSVVPTHLELAKVRGVGEMALISLDSLVNVVSEISLTLRHGDASCILMSGLRFDFDS